MPIASDAPEGLAIRSPIQNKRIGDRGGGQLRAVTVVHELVPGGTLRPSQSPGGVSRVPAVTLQRKLRSVSDILDHGPGPAASCLVLGVSPR